MDDGTTKGDKEIGYVYWGKWIKRVHWFYHYRQILIYFGYDYMEGLIK